jgi:PiT family inorganic phosphate transporter
MTPGILLTLGLAFGFYMAWNIGANDVANAFGTSVGSGALTFRRALVLAAIFEFAGAFLAGAHVSDTIKAGIVHPDLFAGDPEIFARGMLSALLASAVWLHVATMFGRRCRRPMRSSGAVIGFGGCAVGPNAIQWHKLGGIAASWFISPVMGGILAFRHLHRNPETDPGRGTAGGTRTRLHPLCGRPDLLHPVLTALPTL